jgi:hypothetical protein
MADRALTISPALNVEYRLRDFAWFWLNLFGRLFLLLDTRSGAASRGSTRIGRHGDRDCYLTMDEGYSAALRELLIPKETISIQI